MDSNIEDDRPVFRHEINNISISKKDKINKSEKTPEGVISSKNKK
jgi:hypothetical protein